MVKGPAASPVPELCWHEGGELSSAAGLVTHSYVPAAAHLCFPGGHVGSVHGRAAPPNLTLPHPGYSSIN